MRRILVRVVAVDRQRQNTDGQPFRLDQRECAGGRGDPMRQYLVRDKFRGQLIERYAERFRDCAALRRGQDDGDRLPTAAELRPFEHIASKDAPNLAKAQVQHIAALVADRRPARDHEHPRTRHRLARNQLRLCRIVSCAIRRARRHDHVRAARSGRRCQGCGEPGRCAEHTGDERRDERGE